MGRSVFLAVLLVYTRNPWEGSTMDGSSVLFNETLQRWYGLCGSPKNASPVRAAAGVNSTAGSCPIWPRRSAYKKFWPDTAQVSKAARNSSRSAVRLILRNVENSSLKAFPRHFNARRGKPFFFDVFGIGHNRSRCWLTDGHRAVEPPTHVDSFLPLTQLIKGRIGYVIERAGKERECWALKIYPQNSMRTKQQTCYEQYACQSGPLYWRRSGCIRFD